jgi:hypothetical protein
MLQINTISSKLFSSIFLVGFAFLLLGCGMRFYKSSNKPLTKSLETINLAIQTQKYFIIHQAEKQWHLAMPATVVENGEFNIKGLVEAVGITEAYMADKLKKNEADDIRIAYSRRFGAQNNASHQIHLYLPNEHVIGNEINFPISLITKIENYQTSVFPTVLSHIILNPYILLPFLCSCPYVYSYNNANLKFEGNLYSGAIYPNLERHDYITIPNMAVIDGKYKFRLENPRSDEQQFTNLMQMMVVNHPADVKVLPDRKGNLHTIKDLQKPEVAVSSDSINQLLQVTEKDGQLYQFGEYKTGDDLSSIVLKFKNDAKITNTKLVLSLKNSDWAGYIYKEVMSLFGNKLPVWQKKKMKHSSDEINARSVAQGTLLSAYLKTKNGWKFIDYFNTPGSIITRDLILPIEIADVENDIEIMLKGGFRFWDLDYVAMDFSKDETLQINYLQPKSVLDSLGNDHSASLIATDSNYLNQLTVSDKFDISFDYIPKKENLSQTMILNAKGYYNRLDKFEGKIQLAELMKIKKSSFSAFSKKKYIEIANLYAATKP